MPASTGTGWAQLRQQARSLETQTETLFHTYSQYSSGATTHPKPTEDETRTEAQLQDILTRRDALISQLTRLLDSESTINASALKQTNLSRHREILQEHKHEYGRLRSAIQDARNRANLLPAVRSDIAAYRSANPAAAEEEYMLDERRRIESSHGMVDSVLSQAYAINENFGAQRETLASINRRVVGAASQVPGINSLIGRIGAKKRRDGIILASFIALCFLALLYFR